MNEPVWVTKSVVLAIHAQQVAEHGGPRGLRDAGLLESALDSPRNLFGYGVPDLAALAAAYAAGIARNHPFLDGNKRVSYTITRLFLLLNGADLSADNQERVQTWLSLASGQISEDALAEWLRANIRRL